VSAPAATEAEVRALVGLAALPGIGAATLLGCHRAEGAPAALDALRRGRPGEVRALAERLGPRADLAARLRRAAAGLDLDALVEAHTAGGRQVLVADRAGYPSLLAADPAPPAVLFVEGRRELLEGSNLAIVGTRNTTHVGRELATTLGREAAEAGCNVVSGLALGIDGAAHNGALAALDPLVALAALGTLDGGGPAGAALGRPIGVIASGLDIAYPRRHARLHRRVRAEGVLVSETPLGIRPERWRFPARNRIIAGLAAGVVVVESRRRGGSMTTVDEALDRQREVLAVPGHPLAPASAGTNQLIRDGAVLVRDLDDVFGALGWTRPEPPAGGAAAADPPARTGSGGARPAVPEGAAGAVLRHLLAGPASLDELVVAVRAPMGEVAAALVRLEADGHLTASGSWFELSGQGLRVAGGADR